MTYILTNELYHHGILGQKWGVRRFQNPDGTLTEAGKKRYGTAENFEAGKTLKSIKKERDKIDKAIKSGNPEEVSKNFSKMSSQELQEAFSRIQYNTKISELKTQQVTAGKEKLAEIVAVGTTMKNAMQTVSDVYNVSAKTYNAFAKGKKLPIIGEKGESIDDLTKKFNLVREQQRFKWEKEDRANGTNWQNEIQRYRAQDMARKEKQNLISDIQTRQSQLRSIFSNTHINMTKRDEAAAEFRDLQAKLEDLYKIK